MTLETQLPNMPTNVTGNQFALIEDISPLWLIYVITEATSGTARLYYLPPGAQDLSIDSPEWTPAHAQDEAIDFGDEHDTRGWKVDWSVVGFKVVPSDPAMVYSINCGYSTL
ncbi:MAG: hypothetical protein AAGI11_15215 [Pseudomonadota bacterium]